VEALERADSLGVDVINTSLSYQDYDNSNYDHSYEDLDGITTLAARGGNIAFEKGMLLLNSAGNDGNGFGFVATPADAIGVLTVGAVDSSGEYAPFSSFGPTVDGRIKPDVMAQGVSAAVIDQNGNITTNSGTSLSSPILAGAVACLWQSRPEVTNAQIMQIVRESASLYNNPTNQMGYGIPNLEDAYNALQILSTELLLRDEQFVIYPNPVIENVHINIPDYIKDANYEIYDLLGSLIRFGSVSDHETTINLSSLRPGLYIAVVSSEELVNSFKIVKR